MNYASQAVALLGHIGDVSLILFLLRKRAWRAYPYFSFVILWLSLRSICLPVILGFIPGAYQSFFWNTEAIEFVLRFFIIWEVFRHTFPKGSSLNKILTNGFAGISLGLGIFAVGSAWSYESYSHLHSLYPALERSFGFAQAVLIMAILMAARYYGLELGRNIWGIAIGFGCWVSLATVNNAMIDFTHAYLPYWQILWPWSTVGVLMVWCWAMWAYSPNPTFNEPDIKGHDLDDWAVEWNRATSAARKVIQP